MEPLLLEDIMTAPATCIDQYSSAAAAFTIMRSKGISAVVVTHQDRAVGIVTERDAVLLANQGHNPEATPVTQIMGKPLLSARPDMDYQDGYRLLAQHGFRHLLITDASERLLGIVTEGDFLKRLGNEFLLRFKDISSIMTRTVLTMSPNKLVKDALELMAARNISCVVVTDDTHPLGVFTERDLVRRYGDTDCPETLQQRPLNEVMVQPVTTIQAGQTLPEAMALMEEQGIRRLLVTDDQQRITGLVTRHDIVKQLYDRQVQQLRQLLEEREQQLSETRRALQREKQFRALMERLKTSQQVAHIGSWELDLVTNALWWSDETFLIFDLASNNSQPSYDEALTWVHPQDREEFDRIYRLSLTCQTSLEHTFRLHTQRHHIRYVRVHFQTWLGDDGRPARSVGTIQDITEQQLQRQQVDHTSALLNAVVHGSSDAIFIKDRHGRYLIGNQGMSDLMQTPISDVLGKDDHTLFPADIADQLTSTDRRLMREETFETFEEELLLNGTPTPFLTTKGPVMVNGEVMGTFGIARDLRLVKQAEHERQQHHDRLRAIFDTTRQLIGLLNPDGTIIDINKTALNYFRIDPGEYKDRNFSELALWDKSNISRQHIRTALEHARQGESFSYLKTLHIEGKKSSDIIDFILTPVVDEQGTVMMLVAEGQIVTAAVHDRKRLAESEQRYRSFVTHTKETVFSLEPDQPISTHLPVDEQIQQLLCAKVVTANETMAKRYGYDNLDEVQGLTVAQLHILSGCTDDNFLSNWIKSNYVFNNYVSRAEDEQGISSWYSNDLTAVIEQDCVIRIWGTQANITDRVIAEKAQQQSENLKRGVLNSINSEIAVVNHNGHLITTNNRWRAFQHADCEPPCRIVYGHDSDGNYLQTLKSASSNENSPSYKTGFGIQQILDQKITHFSLEYPCECADTHRWFHITVTPLPNTMAVITHTNITDRKFSELALRESEDTLQLALDAGGAGIWVWNVERDRVFVDERFARLFNIKAHPSVPIATIYDSIHPSDQYQAKQDIEAALSQDQDYVSEYRVLSSDRVRWVSARGRLEHNNDSYHPGSRRFSGVVIDITDRKQAEQELRAERDLQAQYLRTMQTLIVVLNRDARVVMVNRATCELLGYRHSELVGKNWFDISVMKTIDRSQQAAIFEEMIHGHLHPYEYFDSVLQDRYGNSHLIAWNNAIIHDANGRPDGLLSSGQNITQQRKMEDDLRHNEQTLRTIFDQAGVGVALIDSVTGAFLRINHKHCAMLGYTRTALQHDKHNWSVIHPDDLPENQRQIRRLLHGDIRQYSLETRYLHASGNIVWTNLTVTALWEQDDEPKQHIAVVQDISARKESEQQLLQAHNDWVQAMDQFEDAFYLVDMNRKLKRANAAFYQLINRTPEDSIGVHIEQLVHPHGKLIPCPICLAQTEREDTTITLEADDPNNPTDSALEISVKMVRNQLGIPTAMLVSSRNLSKVREIRERLRLAGIVFDNTTEGIMVTDANSVVLEVNQAFTDILGYTRDDRKNPGDTQFQSSRPGFLRRSLALAGADRTMARRAVEPTQGRLGTARMANHHPR